MKLLFGDTILLVLWVYSKWRLTSIVGGGEATHFFVILWRAKMQFPGMYWICLALSLSLLSTGKDYLDEFSLQVSDISGKQIKRSTDSFAVTELLYILPLSGNEAKGKEVWGFSCTITPILWPSFSGLHIVSTVLWEWLYFLTEAIWTYLLAHPT